MKKILFSIAAVTLLTAAFLLAFWALNKPNINDIPSSKEQSMSDDSLVKIPSEDKTSSESTSTEDGRALGPLFSPIKDLIDGGVYKLETVRQKRFGGNSVPVKTTTYYGDGFINIIEEEGHGISTETFIDDSGVYCFDATSSNVYFMTSPSVDTDTIATEGLIYIETGIATVGTAEMTYERYKTEDGEIIDYLFAGNDIKKMKIYSNEDYELISVEISPDISMARTSIPSDAVIIKNS